MSFDSDTDGSSPKVRAPIDPDVLVLDIGSGFIKIGWSGEDAPRLIVPAVLIDNHSQALPASNYDDHTVHNEYTIGYQALHTLQTNFSSAANTSHFTPGQANVPAHISSLGSRNASNPAIQLIRPVERGQVLDWPALTALLDHVFKQELHVNPKDHPILLSVPPRSTSSTLLAFAKLFFGTFNVPSLYMVNSSVLSLFSTGRTTGLVLEVGEGLSTVVPVFESYPVKHAILAVERAGKDVTKELMKELGRREVFFHENQLDLVRDIKEKLCKIRPRPASNGISHLPGSALTKSSAHTLDDSSYELPDGQMIVLDEHCKFQCMELLFAEGIPSSSVGSATSGGKDGPPQPYSQLFHSGNSAANFAQLSASALGSGKESAAARAASASPRVIPGLGPTPTVGGAGQTWNLARLILDSMLMCDPQLQSEMVKSIVVTGGTSMCQGFSERVRFELSRLMEDYTEKQRAGQFEDSIITASDPAAAISGSPSLHPNPAAHPLDPTCVSQMIIIADSQRRCSAWVGGSMFASLPTFSMMRYTAEQYKKDETIVLKKFF